MFCIVRLRIGIACKAKGVVHKIRFNLNQLIECFWPGFFEIVVEAVKYISMSLYLIAQIIICVCFTKFDILKPRTTTLNHRWCFLNINFWVSEKKPTSWPTGPGRISNWKKNSHRAGFGLKECHISSPNYEQQLELVSLRSFIANLRENTPFLFEKT